MGFVRKIGRGIERTFLGGAEREAAERQAQAAREGQQLVSRQFQQTQQGLQPFITGGLGAFEQQQALAGTLGADRQAQALGQLAESPATQFLREQGLRGLENRAAALGGFGGGQRLKALTRFSQGLALQDLNRQRAEIARIAQQGLTAGTALGGAGAQQAARQAQLIGQEGAAEAAGAVAGPSAIRGLLGQAAGLGAAFLLAPTTGGLSLAAAPGIMAGSPTIDPRVGLA